ncbi:MAG: metalloregulator ArsR/SmtB family transcription factor, partial [Trueperaceae bacterium]|nr:metalloregulator ArsR/SmtB family transcription factor [Trueperaceae bacterium]
EFERLLGFFKALANETRLRIVGILANREASVGDLADLLEVREPTVSHHLKQLVDVGLVRAEKRGRWTYYELAPAAFRALCAALAPFTHAPEPSEIAA